MSPGKADAGLTGRVSRVSEWIKQTSASTVRRLRPIPFARVAATADDLANARAARKPAATFARSAILPEPDPDQRRLAHETVLITSDGRRIDVPVDAARGETVGDLAETACDPVPPGAHDESDGDDDGCALAGSTPAATGASDAGGAAVGPVPCGRRGTNASPERSRGRFGA